MTDPIIEREREVLRVQARILDILEPFDDAARIRIMRAVEAFFSEVKDDDIYPIALERMALRVKATEGGPYDR